MRKVDHPCMISHKQHGTFDQTINLVFHLIPLLALTGISLSWYRVRKMKIYSYHFLSICFSQRSPIICEQCLGWGKLCFSPWTERTKIESVPFSNVSILATNSLFRLIQGKSISHGTDFHKFCLVLFTFQSVGN